MRPARLSVNDEKWSRPHHPASLTPLGVQTGSSGGVCEQAPAAIVQGPGGQVSSCSGVTWGHLLPFLLSSAFSTFPVPVTYSLLPVHPSLIHPNCSLSHLPSTLTPLFQCQFLEQPVGIPVRGLIYWGLECSVSEENPWCCLFFRHPRVFLLIHRVPGRQPRHWGCSLW